LLRAFSSGCTALTGVEAISNGVPAFRKPKSKNAATTLLLLGVIAVSMFAGVTALALVSHVHVCPSTAGCVGLGPGQTERTVIAQVGRAVFGVTSPLFYLLQLATALILVLAANTAFNGFPVLASILSRDGYLPRQLHTRGDRLAFSNGILLLSGFAILLIVIFQASPTRLIQLYIIGVFVSFVCSQTGMIRALEPAAAYRYRQPHQAAHDQVPGDQHGRRVRHRRGAGHRAVLQVRQRRLDRRGGHAGHLAHHAGHPRALHKRGPGANAADVACRRPRHPAGQQPGDRPGLQAAPAHPPRAGLRPGDQAKPSGSDHRRRRSRRDGPAA
jgi:hypothetical protein